DIAVLDGDELAPGPPPPDALRRTLVLGDLVVVASAWTLISALAQSAVGRPLGGVPLQVGIATALTLASLSLLRLYQGRVCVDRRVARRRMLVAASVAPALLAAGGRYLDIGALGIDIGP